MCAPACLPPPTPTPTTNPHQEPETQRLQIELFDDDFITKDDPMGRCLVSVGPAAAQRCLPLLQWHHLGKGAFDSDVGKQNVERWHWQQHACFPICRNKPLHMRTHRACAVVNPGVMSRACASLLSLSVPP